jgi:hypothetical protein
MRSWRSLTTKAVTVPSAAFTISASDTPAGPSEHHTRAWTGTSTLPVCRSIRVSFAPVSMAAPVSLVLPVSPPSGLRAGGDRAACSSWTRGVTRVDASALDRRQRRLHRDRAAVARTRTASGRGRSPRPARRGSARRSSIRPMLPHRHRSRRGERVRRRAATARWTGRLPTILISSHAPRGLRRSRRREPSRGLPGEVAAVRRGDPRGPGSPTGGPTRVGGSLTTSPR